MYLLRQVNWLDLNIWNEMFLVPSRSGIVWSVTPWFSPLLLVDVFRTGTNIER